MVKFIDCIDKEGFITIDSYKHECEDDLKNNINCIDITGYSVYDESSFRICLSIEDCDILIKKIKSEISKINQDG